MTRREAAIVSAYTGILIGEFSAMHEYVEEIMGEPVWTHEMGSSAMSEEIKARAEPDFMGIHVDKLDEALSKRKAGA